jgi:hypothetical protein
MCENLTRWNLNVAPKLDSAFYFGPSAKTVNRMPPSGAPLSNWTSPLSQLQRPRDVSDRDEGSEIRNS